MGSFPFYQFHIGFINSKSINSNSIFYLLELIYDAHKLTQYSWDQDRTPSRLLASCSVYRSAFKLPKSNNCMPLDKSITSNTESVLMGLTVDFKYLLYNMCYGWPCTSMSPSMPGPRYNWKSPISLTMDKTLFSVHQFSPCKQRNTSLPDIVCIF